ncbi:sugar phosphate isomerase/epimerase [Ruminococcaceae bacterium OttesenSCG-928-A16]|nr:sugar phosphate isomerase/epimerase [Ruminococcaceae bacterium OttesenSCG-928-A16]
MRCGISTACFYPQNTLDALKQLADAGVPVTEIFLNTFHELEDGYVAKLLDVVQSSGIQVASLHPFTSAMEGFLFATEYQGRFEDGLKMYRRYFEVAKILGADKLVFHGDHLYNVEKFALERYAKNFCILADAGQEYGVTLCHENVSYCRLASPPAVRQIKPLLKNHAAFVLDTKQVQRYGASVLDMARAMGKDIGHVHISDFTSRENCLPPGRGNFNFVPLIQQLKSTGYTGDFVIELYRDGFDTLQDLLDAMAFLNTLLG